MSGFANFDCHHYNIVDDLEFRRHLSQTVFNNV